jgi:flagellar biosynthesis regulator FlaF
MDKGDEIDWAYEQERDRGLEQQLEEDERQQKEDKDYELISIDYSNKSWKQFSEDLLNPNSQLMKDLNDFVKGAKSC